MMEQWIPNLSVDVFDIFFNPQSNLMSNIRIKLCYLDNLNINIIVPIARRFFSIVEQSTIYDEDLIPQDISEVIDCSNGVTIYQIPEFDPISKSLKRKKFRLSEILVELQYINYELINQYKGENIIEMWDKNDKSNNNENSEDEDDYDIEYKKIIEERKKAYDLWKDLENLVPKNINQVDDVIKNLLNNYSYEELKKCFEYDINLLNEVEKHSFIKNLKVKNIFWTLYFIFVNGPARSSRIEDYSFRNNFDKILLNSMYQISDFNNHFIYQSNLHIAILKLILYIINNKFSTNVQINYCINWIKNIGSSYHKIDVTDKCEEAYHLCSEILYKLYKRIRLDNDSDTRLLANDTILYFIDLKGFTEINDRHVNKIYNIIVHNLNDLNTKVCIDILKVINRINPIISLNKWSTKKKDLVEESNFNECVMASQNTGKFKFEHFQMIVRNLNLSGEFYDESENSSGNMYEIQIENVNWLLDLYHMCQASNVLNTVSMNLAKMKGNNINDKIEVIDKVMTRKKLRFWILWEMVRYCILSKMKTTYGNAQQSFEFIRHSLNRIWMNKENINNFENLKFLSKTRYLGYLIPFIDLLELQIYNAYEGTALEKPVEFARSSIIFFSVNRNACEEWFLRARKLIILDSKIFGTSASYVVRHCIHYLSDKINYIKQYYKETYNHLIEYEQVIIELVLALQQLKDPDPIIGIYYWMKKLIIQEMKKNTKKNDNAHLQILIQQKPSTANKESYQYHLEWILVAALVAENKYEEAVVKYRYFLNKYQEDGKLSPNLVSFVIKQIVECYRNLNDWSNIREFLHYVKSVNIENSNYPLCSFENGKNPKLFEAWEDFENNNYHAAYVNISKTSPNFRETYESVGMNRAVMNTSQYYTLYSMLLINEKNNNSFPQLKSMMNKSLALVNEQLKRLDNTFASSKEIMPVVIQLQLVKIIETIGKGNMSNDRNANVLLSEINNNILLNKEVTENVDIAILMRMLDIFSFLDNTRILKDDDYIKKLNYDIAKVARKQGNNILGQKLIQKNLLKIKNDFNVNDIPNMLLVDNTPLFVKDYIFELAKIYINEKKYDKGFNILLDIIDSELRNCDSDDDEESINDEEVIKFRSSVYLKTINFLTKISSSGEFNIEELPESVDIKIRSIASKAEIDENVDIKRSDLLVQSIYSIACDESTISPKIWCKAAHYYYLQAQDLLEEMEIGSVDNIKHYCLYDLKKFILGYSEKKVFWSSNKIFNLNQIYGDCLSILTSLFGASYKIKFENRKLNVTELDYKIKKYLFELFPDLNEELLKELLSILNRIKNVLIGYFTDAVTNYFKYLKYFDEFENDKIEIKDDQECNMTKIALRLLHVFENYGIYIVRVYREGFANTPIAPWEKIIPQLFTRLDHPEPFVQDQICSLICRIGIISPHLIVYPAIVGISTSTSSTNNNDTRCLYQNIIDSLIQSGSEMLVKEIGKMISELQRVTVLWEETLLNKLTQLQGETDRRFARLKKENERVNNNNQLTKEEKDDIIKNNYNSLLKPVIHIIESFYNEINNEPQNNHERWFHQNYKEILEDAIDNLKDTSNESFQKAWEPFNSLYKEIAKEVQKNRRILLADVSPYLANIKESQIPLPGIYNKNEIVYIQHFDDYVYALPTKTKPKRINLYGSDGNVYTYLLKGLEDLHLDERIMQLLSCTNNILKGNKKSNSRHLQARYYSVVPLSGHLGMIQWVTNATQMFYLYKKWQQRKYAKEVQSGKNNEEHNISFAIRPHEMFYNKLDAQFKKNNLVRGSIRKNWPINIQRYAFLELRHETPSDLIAKEFWTTSSSPTVWWEKTNSYSRSLAVMSIIGYIIGLGDRHLDNILIDFDTGEVIHIDYNVCFEKGKKLCVPETVPFRLTQNLQTALGVYGIEGPFRIACENVLSVLRSNKEILMTILESFIYDPLVDWSNDYKKNKEKQLIELNVNIGLLSTRIAGLCPVIRENRELFINNLRGLQHYLKVHMTEVSYRELYKGNNKEVKESKESSDSIEHSNISESSNILMYSSKSDTSNAKLSTDVQNLDVVEEDNLKLNNKEIEFLEYMKKELSKVYEKCENKSQQFQTTYGTLHGTFLHNIQNQIGNVDLNRLRISVKNNLYPHINDNMDLIEKIKDLFKKSESWKVFRTNAIKSYFKHLNAYQVITAPISNGLLNQDYYTNIYKLLNNIFDNGDNRKVILENIKALNEFINDRNNDDNLDHEMCIRVASLENLMKNTYMGKYEVLREFKDDFDEIEMISQDEIDEAINEFDETLSSDNNKHIDNVRIILLNYFYKYSNIVLDMINNKEIDIKQFTEIDISRELHIMFCIDVFDMRQLKEFYLIMTNIFNLSKIFFKIAEIRQYGSASFYKGFFKEQEILTEFVKSLMKIPQDYLFRFIPQLLRSINDNTIDIQFNLIESIAKQIDKLKQTSDYQNIREIRHQYSGIVNNLSGDNNSNVYYNKQLINVFLPVEKLMLQLKEECSNSEEKEYYEELEDRFFVLKIKNFNEANKAMKQFYKSISVNDVVNLSEWIDNLDTKVLIAENPAFKTMRESINEFIRIIVETICLKLISSELKNIFSELFINLEIQEKEKYIEFEDYIRECEQIIQLPKYNKENHKDMFDSFQVALNIFLRKDLYNYCKCCVIYVNNFAEINRDTYIRYQLLNDYPLLKAREFDDYPGDDKEFIDLEHIDKIEYTTNKSIRKQIIELCSKDIENLKESISSLRNLERKYNNLYDIVESYSQKQLLNGLMSQDDVDDIKKEIDNIKSKVDTSLLSEHQKFNYLIEFASLIILLETTRIDDTEETNEISYIVSLNIKEFEKVLNQNNSNNRLFNDTFYSDDNNDNIKNESIDSPKNNKRDISFEVFVNTIININNPAAKDADISNLFYRRYNYDNLQPKHHTHSINNINNDCNDNSLIMTSDDHSKSGTMDDSIINADFIQIVKNTFDITLKLYKDIQALTSTALKPAERIKEPIECVEEINTLWVEWDIYCREFIKIIDELQTSKSADKVETVMIKRISELISAFETVSAKLINLQNISNKPSRKVSKRTFHNRHSHRRSLNSSRSNSSISIRMNASNNSSKDPYSAIINEEVDFNNNGSDENIGSEKEKSSNNNSNDIEDTYDDKDKQIKGNYQFTERNNEDYDNDADTQQEQSIEEIDKEISKNNDIIYHIQENIKLSNEMEANSLFNNKEMDENESYTNTNTDSNLVNNKGAQKLDAQEYDPSLLFKEDGENGKKSHSRSSSSNTNSNKLKAMMIPSEEESVIESVINSMNLPEEVADTPKISERNLQAMKILYRIRDKLNGYDPLIDPSVMDVTKHVDKVINQAINIDNLACMYEGWTSWI